MAQPTAVQQAATAPGRAAVLAHRPRASARRGSIAASRHRRGAAMVVRATGAAAYQPEEWEVYRAECSFHQQHVQRTLHIMQQISRELHGEWQTYTAEAAVAGAAQHLSRSPEASRTVVRRRALAKNAVQQQPAPEATTIVGDIFDDAMRPGGYHLAVVGEQFKHGRYTALYPLGQGHYATVWMVLDSTTQQQLAMKIVRSAPAYSAAARNEVALLQHIREAAAASGEDHPGAQRCVTLVDTFEHAGPHGRHVCEVFEAMGDDLLTLIKEYNFRGMPLGVVRHLVRQTLQALDYLHNTCAVIHTDLKPENVMLAEPIRPRGGRSFTDAHPSELDLPSLEPRLMRMDAKVVDFGCACLVGRPLNDDIQTRQYRAPEVILGAGYDDAADIWSLACMVFELVTGDLLFHPEARAGEWSEDEDHLAQMMETLQPIPREVATSGKYSADFFTPEGRLHSTARRLQPMPLDWVLHEKYQLAAEEALALRDFMLPMLSFDPARRASAAEMLQHPWLAM